MRRLLRKSEAMGLYLRGDVGVHSSNGRAAMMTSAWLFGGGIGYQYNEWMRDGRDG